MVFNYIFILIVQGISTAIVLVRVEMGLSHDYHNKTSISFTGTTNSAMTGMRFAAPQCDRSPTLP